MFPSTFTHVETNHTHIGHAPAAFPRWRGRRREAVAGVRRGRDVVPSPRAVAHSPCGGSN